MLVILKFIAGDRPLHFVAYTVPIFCEHTSQDYGPKMQIMQIESRLMSDRVELSSSFTHLFHKCP